MHKILKEGASIFTSNRAIFTNIYTLTLIKQLLLTVPPKLSPFHASVLSLNVGDRASLTCSVVKGDLPLDITWLKDGRQIDTNRMSVTLVDQYNSILVIDHLSSDHTGNYSCSVKNSAAEVENTQALLVNGKPKTIDCLLFY